jgi:cobalt-zinc-cadmium efflux system outer membrane protein
LWGEPSAEFALPDAALERLPVVPAFDALLERLNRNPDLRRFADESRLRDAQVRLAESARRPDLEWQVGVRRLQADDDWALLGSVTIPFGGSARAAPGIRAAEAVRDAVAIEQEGMRRTLEATLAEAWGQLDAAVAEAEQIDGRLLPVLQRAAAAAERAYRAGAGSFTEWQQVQFERVDVERERLQAAVRAHRALIELQRLTGERIDATVASFEESHR